MTSEPMTDEEVGDFIQAAYDNNEISATTEAWFITDHPERHLPYWAGLVGPITDQHTLVIFQLPNDEQPWFEVLWDNVPTDERQWNGDLLMDVTELGTTFVIVVAEDGTPINPEENN